MSMTFWSLAVLMILGTLLGLLPALLRAGQAAGNISRKDYNVAVYRQRLDDLEQQHGAGEIDDEQLSQARVEMEKALVSEATDAADDKLYSGRQWATAAVISIAVPALAIALYGHYGNQRALATGPAVAQQTAGGQVPADHPQAEGGQMPSLEAMVSGLAERLRADPNNAQGWVMLGRSYRVMERPQEAEVAFSKAYQLTPDDPMVLTSLVEARALLNDGGIQTSDYALLERALELAPADTKALWLAGASGYQRQDYQKALTYWERLDALQQPGSPDAEFLAKYLAEVRESLGIVAPAVTPTAPRMVARADVSQSAGEAPVINNAPDAAGSAHLSVKVHLSPELAAKAAPGDTVFVFARAAQGPRMPLAIVRKAVADLPLEVSLDDSMSMTPAMRLSNFEQVVVGARVSKSGQAMPQSGDLQGTSAPMPSTSNIPVEITINQVI